MAMAKTDPGDRRAALSRLASSPEAVTAAGANGAIVSYCSGSAPVIGAGDRIELVNSPLLKGDSGPDQSMEWEDRCGFTCAGEEE